MPAKLTVVHQASSELTSAMVDMKRDLRARNKSEATISQYTWAVELLDRHLAERGRPRDPAAVTKDDIREFVTVQRETKSDVTAATYFAALRAFFSFCVAEEIIDRSPFEGLRAPAVGTSPVQTLSDAEVEALLKITQGRSFVDRRDHAIFRLLLDTGARRAELMSLRVEDVDLDSEPARILIRRGKGNKARWAPFGNLAAKALSHYLRARRTHKHAESEALWLSPWGEMKPNALNGILVERCRQAGISRIGAHRFRHAFADRMLSAGMNEGDLMRLGGWANATMIQQRYGASRADARAMEAYARIGAPGDQDRT